jgi:hypothetical protein
VGESAVDGIVRVPYKLESTGVIASRNPDCVSLEGKFELLAMPLPNLPCSTHVGVSAHRSDSEGTVLLPEGNHTLLVRFVDAYGTPFKPALQASVHIKVRSATSPVNMDPCSGYGGPCASEPLRPKDAAIAFTEPLDGATIVTDATEGLLPVPFAVRGEHVTFLPYGVCAAGAGSLRVRALPHRDRCPWPQDSMSLRDGKSAGELNLAAGQYELEAELVDGYGAAYEPRITTSIHVTVADQGPDQHPCPRNPKPTSHVPRRFVPRAQGAYP